MNTAQPVVSFLNPQEMEYLSMMLAVRNFGEVKTDRTGTGTKSDFGKVMRFNLQEGIPILTTKKIHLKSIIHENIWFLSGSTNIQYLKDNGVTIWDEWADENGDLGPVYGGQWRRWEDFKMVPLLNEAKIADLERQGYERVGTGTYGSGSHNATMHTHCILRKEYDQITDALNLIKNNPDSRRIIVNAWNVGDIPGMKLPPCHAMYQFYVSTMTLDERYALLNKKLGTEAPRVIRSSARPELNAQLDAMDHQMLDKHDIPRKKLSCMLYQRSIH